MFTGASLPQSAAVRLADEYLAGAELARAAQDAVRNARSWGLVAGLTAMVRVTLQGQRADRDVLRLLTGIAALTGSIAAYEGVQGYRLWQAAENPSLYRTVGDLPWGLGAKVAKFIVAEDQRTS